MSMPRNPDAALISSDRHHRLSMRLGSERLRDRIADRIADRHPHIVRTLQRRLEAVQK